ncbi:nucleotidyl transferase AbiEii/AbiGii toxin family protein [Candidatus Peregrinibacteria bacterium]|nr:nucleotidyl transferase AbiEii/AbiGii toxin family protein [Candidatus Peregrinibacteria bacterium]MBI3816922.1 nucleotidyl transferase AbiEii/AbiGii toxin family protein [Candidatus Peregrinibacteria bacterium]
MKLIRAPDTVGIGLGVPGFIDPKTHDIHTIGANVSCTLHRVNSYKNIFQALSSAKVNYLIVGGVAMNLLGCPRFTNDIDVLLALDRKNLRAMQEAMKALGYERRIPLSLDELGDEKKARKFIEEKNLLAYTFFNPKEPLYSVDIIVGASREFERYREHHMLVDVWGLRLPVIAIDDLIGLKKASDRGKDALDVATLLEYKGL